MLRVPLVLLPGMMCDARLFGPQLQALAGVADIWVGDITRQRTTEALAEAVLRQAPFDRFALAGLSMGGIVAMAMVSQAPERIARLGLLDTNHLAEAPERQALRQPQIDRALAGELRSVLIDEMKPNYLAPEHRNDGALLDLVLAMGLDLGPRVFERQSLALRDRPDASATLQRYEGPTLLLCGEHDRLCPPERHRTMAGLLRHADLTVVKGAGHLTTLEAPLAVNAALERWLLEPIPRQTEEQGRA
jgi:pimeloyl-ACP methyl ester carboxylesterase